MPLRFQQTNDDDSSEDERENRNTGARSRLTPLVSCVNADGSTMGYTCMYVLFLVCVNAFWSDFFLKRNFDNPIFFIDFLFVSICRFW